MKKKVIILGATGHVGSYMTLYAKDFFADKGMEVIASGRREKADVFPEMGVQYISVDMTKAEDFDKLPKTMCMQLFNLLLRYLLLEREIKIL